MSIAPKKAISRFLFIVSVLIASILTSCNTSKKVKYFQNIPDSLQTHTMIPIAPYVEPKIEINDILYISVQTIEQKEVAKQANSGIASEELLGYKVDKNGEVDVPLVGSVKLEGLTTAEAKEAVKEKAKKFYVDPVVNVKFANHYINVFGEVAKPGRILMPVEKVSIMDAITLAGDLTIQGKRENVLLVRDEGGNKVAVRMDLNSTNLFQSPYFYLKSGDYVYIEPNQAKKRGGTVDATRDRYITYITSFISLGLAVTTIILSTSK